MVICCYILEGTFFCVCFNPYFEVPFNPLNLDIRGTKWRWNTLSYTYWGKYMPIIRSIKFYSYKKICRKLSLWIKLWKFFECIIRKCIAVEIILSSMSSRYASENFKKCNCSFHAQLSVSFAYLQSECDFENWREYKINYYHQYNSKKILQIAQPSFRPKESNIRNLLDNLL